MAHSSKNGQDSNVCGSVARWAIDGHSEGPVEVVLAVGPERPGKKMSQVVYESFLEKGDF